MQKKDTLRSILYRSLCLIFISCFGQTVRIAQCLYSQLLYDGFTESAQHLATSLVNLSSLTQCVSSNDLLELYKAQGNEEGNVLQYHFLSFVLQDSADLSNLNWNVMGTFPFVHTLHFCSLQIKRQSFLWSKMKLVKQQNCKYPPVFRWVILKSRKFWKLKLQNSIEGFRSLLKFSL